MLRRWPAGLVSIILGTAGLLPGTLPALAGTTAKYVMLFHGDGMGPEHVRAGGMFASGAAGTLSFEGFPRHTTMRHNNALNETTDSAASATAMATGVKVYNGVVSVRLPGDGAAMTSLLELQKALGKGLGLVTESTLTDASPAAHAAHASSRSDTSGIFSDYIHQTRPHVLFGGGGSGFDTVAAQLQGYALVTNRAGLLALDTEGQTRVAGSFGAGMIPTEGTAGRDPGLPTLPEMTRQALAVVDNHASGFFLFVEHEAIDEYSHASDSGGMVRAVKEFDAAVQEAIAWVENPGNDANWSNTLLVVLADHETGGLTVTETNPQAGVVPAVTWSSGGSHTQIPVPVYAQGAGADQITGTQIDNTDIFDFLRPEDAGLLTPAPTPVFTPHPTPTLAAADDALRVYPVPAKDKVYFSLRLENAAIVRILVHNLAGEIVAEIQESLAVGDGELVWACGTAGPGIYLARVIVNGQEWRRIKLAVAR